MKKIEEENIVMLKRLQDRKSNYNAANWARQEDQRHKLVKQICEYPYSLRNSTHGTPLNKFRDH